MRIIIFILVFVTFQVSAWATNNPLKNFVADKAIEYIITLKNGDEITGNFIEYINDPELGEGIKFKTAIGEADIFYNQIVTVLTVDDSYKHSHRVFLMPTAYPIGNNNFAGDFELAFLYFGFGIGDIASITAGRSLIPGMDGSQQLSIIDAKATVYDDTFDDIKRRLLLAVGGNLSFVNSANKMIHLYGVGTVKLSKTTISATLFYKAGSNDMYRINYFNNYFDMTYTDGSFGIGLGIDTRFSDVRGLHFIGELWNSDIAKPTNTGILLGLRLCNSKFSADFGIAFFTQPFVAPFTSFVWTPFNY